MNHTAIPQDMSIKDKSKIRVQLDNIKKVVDQLYDQFNVLHERLKPILSPLEDTESKNIKRGAYPIPLVEELASIHDSLEGRSEELKVLLDRLQL